MARVATLLIVEDEPETAGLLRSYFQAQGYEVLTAASGEEALALARERLPDLVVLDIRLPDIDGFEVFRQLRAHRRTREIPVIFLTEKREREDRLAGLELGAHDYIPKPFSLQELRARVQNILRRSQVEPAFDGLTGLPGRPLILEHLQEQLGHAEWSVVLIGLDGLEAFGERYGFIARDDAIRAVGLVLAGVNHESGDPFFLGHLGEGWFVVVGERHLLGPAAERMVARLKNALPYFYPLQDVEEHPEDLPPLQVVTAQVHGAEGPFHHPEEILGRLQERKRAIP
ncbi:response regulator [Thermoflexus sp.]|jgi:PleD family two-component response regulator|uniref:response regulator n=1 Tax=Thermoflexus sp. TaxID=1969742 RepID=UPI00260F6787|nr:response regulator [Thermoflexus sp.]MDT7947823.1 response regulator [Thermoflexus sp.]